MKKNKDILIFSAIILVVLIYSATAHLYKIQIGTDADKLAFLYILNVLFIVQIYIHFYSYLNQLLFNKFIYDLRSVNINKGYKGVKLLYHCFICFFVLYYFYIMSGNETLDELYDILFISNYTLYLSNILFKRGTKIKKGEIDADLFEFATIALLEVQAKIYYVSYDTKLESFEVYSYKILEDKRRVLLYNKEQLSPQITIKFKKPSNRIDQIISFLSENCILSE